ncbi:hypothetical protein HOLleu_36836 [Holothuria leucospilota]|uniref:Uncharacterized protein n=1 Tax=Holothuria leucospilota TaxID=206669 RepID=A0A9Q1BFY4_HOLLE|nr:hypothetical protein HOLleu_36836 [Holothuria leucospilota]
MNKYRFMVFKLEQTLTQDVAVSIARYFDLPKSTVDKIQRENPGITLLIALEQRLIICEDDDKLRDLHTTFKAMDFHDLAGIIEELHPQFKKVKNKRSNKAESPVTSTCSRSSFGETSDEGRLVMSPASIQVKPRRSNKAESPVISNSGRSSFGETSDEGRLVMSPASMQEKTRRSNKAESPVISNSCQSSFGETSDEGRLLMSPASIQGSNREYSSKSTKKFLKIFHPSTLKMPYAFGLMKPRRSNKAESPGISNSGLSSFGETSDEGRLLMSPASIQEKPRRSNKAESPVISNSCRSCFGETSDEGRKVSALSLGTVYVMHVYSHVKSYPAGEC